MHQGLYQRIDKPLYTAVTGGVRKEIARNPADMKIAEPVAVHSSTNCFVSPPEWAERLVDYLAPSDDMEIFEPQAGTGNLIHALVEYGHPLSNIFAVEREWSLVQACASRFPDLNIQHGCFLEFAHEMRSIKYDAIVMNPPFNRGEALKHVKAACGLLKPDGQLFGIVPSTFEHSAAYDLEDIPPGAFANTNVSTKIIQIDEAVLSE